MGTAGHLIWPSLIQVLSVQVVLAHPPHRFPFLTRTVRERIPVAGYDRISAVFFKEQREELICPLTVLPKKTASANLFDEIFLKFFYDPVPALAYRHI